MTVLKCTMYIPVIFWVIFVIYHYIYCYLQFDLVCDKAGRVSLLQTIYMLGFLTGCISFGQISDKSVKSYKYLIVLFFTFYPKSSSFSCILFEILHLYSRTTVCLICLTVLFWVTFYCNNYEDGEL